MTALLVFGIGAILIGLLAARVIVENSKHRCEWSKWSEPETVEAWDRSGKLRLLTIQRRTCVRCDLIEVRRLSA